LLLAAISPYRLATRIKTAVLRFALPIMADIFISYAREDQERIELLKKALEAQGWTVAWDKQLPPGDGFRKGIEGLIAQARCMIVAWSRWSVDSDWVRAEAERGRKRNILIPVLLDNDITVPIPFDELQTFSLADWDGTPPSLDHQFLNAVTGKAGPPALVRLLRQCEIRSTRKMEGLGLYDDICLVIDSFSEESCQVATIVRDECSDPTELSTSQAYNRYDVVPIIVMCDDALVELNYWYGQVLATHGKDESKLADELWVWTDQVLMLTSVVIQRLAEAIEPSSSAYRFLLRVGEAVLRKLKLEMRRPPSGWTLFHEARKGADEALLVLREADVRLMANGGPT
jgi:hypothetical protein